MGDHDRAKNKRKYPDTGVACGTLVSKTTQNSELARCYFNKLATETEIFKNQVSKCEFRRFVW
jgi:hypothetical protein